MRLSLGGLAAIVVLLWFALRSLEPSRAVLAPLVLAVLTVAAVLALCGVELTILHLVGMLLIVAVGSNYALFFDSPRRDGEDPGATLGVAVASPISAPSSVSVCSPSPAFRCSRRWEPRWRRGRSWRSCSQRS